MLIGLAALSILVSPAVGAQTTKPPPTATAQAVPDEGQSSDICAGARLLREKITVARGPRKMEILLGVGTCETGGSEISDMSVGYATDDSMADYVEAESCPAYRLQIAKLWSARKHNPHDFRTITNVRVGPFAILDWSDLFELRSSKGRVAAARWIHQTLALVRPCWNNFRDDHTRYVVGRLYTTLSMRRR